MWYLTGLGLFVLGLCGLVTAALVLDNTIFRYTRFSETRGSGPSFASDERGWGTPRAEEANKEGPFGVHHPAPVKYLAPL